MSSKSSYSTILRYTGVLAALGSVVAGILHSCSGYAGFWPWLLAAGPRRQENAKTRVDRRSTRDFALYRCFGRAGLLWWFLGCWLLWWVGCCSCGHTLEYRMTRWISERTRTRRITDYVCTRLVSKSPVQGVTFKQ